MTSENPKLNDKVSEAEAAKQTEQRRRVAELCFIAFLAIVGFAALFEAFTYSITASRTPLVILVPLLLLIILLAFREGRAAIINSTDVLGIVRKAVRGGYPQFRKFVQFTLWLMVLIAMVIVLGHYIAVGVFTYILMRLVSKEAMSLSLKISLAVPFAIFLIFDLALGLNMFPGILYQLWAGYQIF